MAEERTIRYRVTAATQGFQQGMQRSATSAQQASGRIGSSMQRNKQALTMAGTAAVGFGLAMGTGLAKAASAGAEFESQMNSVRAVSGATGAEFEALSGAAREMGRSTQFGASEAAEGLSFLSMAGLDATESVEALPGVLDLAAAGGMELARSADIASNVMSGFGMEADELGGIVDTMAATFTSSNTSLEQMGDAMSYVAPVANAAGLEIEETAAAIGVMGDSGIQGTRAGTALRQALSSLMSPTGGAADAIERLGLEVTNSEGKLLGLDDIIGQLEDSGATGADVMELFGTRAGPGMQTLLDRGSDGLREFTRDLEDSGGTAQEVAQTQLEGLRGSMTELGSAVEAVQIKIAEDGGLLDGLASMADLATGAARGLESLPDPAIKAGTQMASAATAVSLFGGAALIAGPRVASLVDRLGGLRNASARFGVLTVLTSSVFELTEGFQRGQQEADAMMQEIIEGSESADEAIGKLGDSLREHLESMGEVDASNIGNAFLGFAGAARNAGDTIGELVQAWKLWRGESEVAAEFAEDHGAALALVRGEVGDLTTALLDLDMVAPELEAAA